MRSAPRPEPRASFDAVIDRVKVATFMGTDRPHVLRQAIHSCRNFGTVSIVGVYGGFLDKIPMGSAINRGLTFRMAQTPVQHYLPNLMERHREGRDRSVLRDHATAHPRGGPGTLQDVPRQEGRLHQGGTEAMNTTLSPKDQNRSARPLAIVTGASSGIGFELAKKCAGEGFDLRDRRRRSQADRGRRASILRQAGAPWKRSQVDLVHHRKASTSLVAAVSGPPDRCAAGQRGAWTGQGIPRPAVARDRAHVVDTNVTGTLYLLTQGGPRDG